MKHPEIFSELLAAMLDRLLLPLQGEDDPFPQLTGLYMNDHQIKVYAMVGQRKVTGIYDLDGNFIEEENRTD